jgi:hypothetical protein
VVLPHRARHTAAITFVRGGGSTTVEPQQMFGHTDLEMTRRYLAIADSDLKEQRRPFSPVHSLLRQETKKATAIGVPTGALTASPGAAPLLLSGSHTSSRRLVRCREIFD